MKKLRKIGVAVICIATFLCLIPLVNRLTRNDLEKAVMSCKKYYEPSWKLDNIQEDTEQKYIFFKFCYRYKNYGDRFLCIKNTIENLTNILLEPEDSKWGKYTLRLGFLNVGDYFDVIVNEKQLQVTTNMNISVEKIAELFPDTDVLSLYPARYNSIIEIQGFEDLKEIRFSQGLTDEEKAYVWSLFPNCIIED